MSKSNIQNRAENAERLMETLNKVFLGFIPGGHAAEAFLNFRNDLKSKRTVNFLEKFSDALKEIAQERELDLSNFTTEDFVDVFDCVIAKVQNCKSELKIERFKNILLKQTIQPLEDQLILKLINIVDDLNDLQIILLEKLSTEKQERDLFTILTKVVPKRPFSFSPNINQSVEITFQDLAFNTDTDTIQFLLNDLESKGLLHSQLNELGRKKIGQLSTDKEEKIETKKRYKISPVANDLLKMIKN